VTKPGIPNELVLSTSCYGPRLRAIEDQAFSAVAMGFRRLELGLSPTPADLAGWEDAHRETGIQADSVVVGALNPLRENMSGSLLGSADGESRERALNSTRRHIRLAQRLGAPVVVVRGCAVENGSLAGQAQRLTLGLEEADEDSLPAAQAAVADFVHKVQKRGQKQLEHFCRSIHTLRREFPETRIAIEPGLHFNDLLNFEAMEWALADLASESVGYWHDTARIHRRQAAGLPGQGDWLDAFAGRMYGVHLGDASHDEEGLPPGSGEIDFQLVHEYVPQGVPNVVEVAPTHGRAEVLASVQYLLGMGF
jgi:sugar phosphate isomerase/epimerase